ncbi:hypothetical protein FBU30_003576 [Linnemannia zychae]|nr:hypothetical protein FBU30_003576 [Linnemannia zychae]
MKFTALITLAVATALAVTDAAPASPTCGGLCPDVISPVCAENAAGAQATFDNSCLVAQFNCKYPSNQYTVISKGYCAQDLSKRADCGGKCPAVIAPVCAQNAAGDQKSFNNSCLLSQYNCKFPSNQYTQIANGACALDLSKRADCGGKCPAVIAPVCAQNAAGDQKSFNNSCLLSQYNCKFPNNQYTQIAKGSCALDLSKRIVIGDLPVEGCGGNCPTVITPLCAKNNDGVERTFNNKCYLTIAQCQYPKENWTQISSSTCLGDLN